MRSLCRLSRGRVMGLTVGIEAEGTATGGGVRDGTGGEGSKGRSQANRCRTFCEAIFVGERLRANQCVRVYLVHCLRVDSIATAVHMYLRSVQLLAIRTAFVLSKFSVWTRVLRELFRCAAIIPGDGKNKSLRARRTTHR